MRHSGNSSGGVCFCIIIADDHQVFRQGLKRLLGDDSRFQLLGEAKNGQEALALIEQLRPDVAVLDFAMPRPDGVEVAAQVTAEKNATKCIILTMKEELYAVKRALAAGVRGSVSSTWAPCRTVRSCSPSVEMETYPPGKQRFCITSAGD